MFDGLTRRTAFLTLGAVGLAGLGRSPATHAKTRRKKGMKEDPKKLCKKQTGQCLTFLNPTCNGDPKCLAIAQQCCPLLGSCNTTAFLDCVVP